jgi:hypothetical protein
MKINIIKPEPLLSHSNIREAAMKLFEAEIPSEKRKVKPTFPMDYILYKFPKFKGVLVELLTVTFKNYIENIYVVAPKPTTFKVVLKTKNEFFIIHDDQGYTIKASGNKYYLGNIGEKQRATQAIADLLMTKKFITSKEETTEESESTDDSALSGGTGGPGGGDFPGGETGGEAGATPGAEEPAAGEGDLTGDDLDALIGGDEGGGEDTGGGEDESPLAENTILRIRKPLLFESKKNFDINEGMLSLNSVKKRPHQLTSMFYNEDPFQIGNNGEKEIKVSSIVVDGEIFYPQNKEEQSKLMGALKNVDNARKIQITGKSGGQELILRVSSIFKSSKLGGQSGGGAGISNENELIDNINNFIEQSDKYLNITFVDENNIKITIPNVIKADKMGSTGSVRGLKGDVKLITTNGSQNISVKKDGNFWWSSERKNFSELLNKFIELGKKGNIPNLIIKQNPTQPKILDMVDPKDNRRYGRIFIVNYPGIDDNIENITFGPDKVKIIQRTFSPLDFNLSGNLLTIKTTRNIDNVTDLKPEDKPIIMLARHENQKYGIDFRTIPLKQAKFEPTRGGKTLVLNYNDL